MQALRSCAGACLLVLPLAGCGGEPAVVELPGEPAPLVPRELFWPPERWSDLRLSPDGATLAMLVESDGPVELRWLDLEGGEAPQSVELPGAGEMELEAWSGDALVVARRNPEGERRLYAVSSPSLVRPLTPEGAPARLLGVGADGAAVVGIGEPGEGWLDPHRVDPASGDRDHLLDNERFVDFGIDRDGDLRLAIEATRAGRPRMLQRSEEGGWADLTLEAAEQVDAVTLIDLGGHGEIARLWLRREGGGGAIVAWRLTSGETDVLFDGGAAAIAGWTVDPVGGRLQAVATEDPAAGVGALRWHLLDPAVAEPLRQLTDSRLTASPLPASQWSASAAATIEQLERSADDEIWVASVRQAGKRSLVRLDRPTGERTVLLEAVVADGAPRLHRATLDGEGASLRLDWSLPPEMDPNGDGRPAKPLPAVVLLASGPWPADDLDFATLTPWLVNRGYAVVRLTLPASGGVGERAASPAAALAAAARWAVDQGVADEERVAALGGGYGGYPVLAALGAEPRLLACAATAGAPPDLSAWVAELPRDEGAALERLRGELGDPDTRDGRERLEKLSPLATAAAVERPVLVVRGEDDRRAGGAPTRRWAEAATSAGAAVSYAVVPGEASGWQRTESHVAFAALVETFLGDCLGGRVEPLATDTLAAVDIEIGREHLASLPTGGAVTAGASRGSS